MSAKYTSGPWRDQEAMVLKARYPDAFQNELNAVLSTGHWRVIATEMYETNHHYTAVLIRSEDPADLRRKYGEAIEALKGVMGLVESGWLVRDITNDSDPDWALKQIKPVAALKNAHDILARASAPDPGPHSGYGALAVQDSLRQHATLALGFLIGAARMGHEGAAIIAEGLASALGVEIEPAKLLAPKGSCL